MPTLPLDNPEQADPPNVGWSNELEIGIEHEIPADTDPHSI